MKIKTAYQYKYIDGRLYIDAMDLINSLKLLKYDLLAKEMEKSYYKVKKKFKKYE